MDNESRERARQKRPPLYVNARAHGSWRSDVLRIVLAIDRTFFVTSFEVIYQNRNVPCQSEMSIDVC